MSPAGRTTGWLRPSQAVISGWRSTLPPVGLVVSRNRAIQLCNDALIEIFGYARGELEGQSLQMLYPSLAEFETIGARGLPVMRQMGFYSDEAS